MAHVIPLLKPGTPPDDSMAHRPILPVAKLIVKLVLPTINRNIALTSHRTVMTLNFTKAFDTVTHSRLLHDIKLTDIPNVVKIWSYICDKYTYVEFRNAKLSRRRLKQGVPQGSVIY